jgi:LacI family transcriptional regulator
MTTVPSNPDQSGTAGFRGRGRRPRVKDVARRAGVSVGTVSNVVNGRESVGAEVRRRVEAAIEELGFVRNASAKSLRTGVLPLVGVAVLDITNPFFMEAAAGTERRLDQEGCVMALSSTRSDSAEEARLLRTLAAQGVRGILLTPTDSSLSVAHEIVNHGIPVVLFDSPAAPEDMSSILVDDRAGAAVAIDHLCSIGHHRIAFLNGPGHVRQAMARRAGVDAAIERFKGGVQLDVHELETFTAGAGRDAARSMLTEAGFQAPMGTDGVGAHTGPLAPPELPDDFPTAIFCANDLIAFGAMTALRDAGVRIPQDVSLVGFDDISMASQMSVPLTTVHQPMGDLGWAAADMLLTDPTTIRHLTFLPSLVVRESTAVPRQ